MILFADSYHRIYLGSLCSVTGVVKALLVLGVTGLTLAFAVLECFLITFYHLPPYNVAMNTTNLFFTPSTAIFALSNDVLTLRSPRAITNVMVQVTLGMYIFAGVSDMVSINLTDATVPGTYNYSVEVMTTQGYPAGCFGPYNMSCVASIATRVTSFVFTPPAAGGADVVVNVVLVPVAGKVPLTEWTILLMALFVGLSSAIFFYSVWQSILPLLYRVAFRDYSVRTHLLEELTDKSYNLRNHTREAKKLQARELSY